MTRLAKMLVVFTAAASLGFLAFVFALLRGGANWPALATALESEAYGRAVTIAAPQIPDGPWTATHNRDKSSISSSKLLPEVILASQKRILDDLQKETQTVNEEITRYTQARDEALQLVAVDRKALDERGTALSAQLAKLQSDIASATDQLTQRLLESSQVQAQLDELRAEVFRAMNILEIVRDDQFGFEQQRDALRDELLQLQETERKLRERNEQLQQQVSGGGYEAP